ncbi:MAG: hypothetical protein JSS80_10890 [Bacteroidetes bacterium]|nr:hypothetical protein [Bacteroidota bacterium]
MLKIISSLSFLYALTFCLLLWYGLYYYRSLPRPGKRRKLFLPVFFVISIACFLFLWINMHAPLSMKTYSNLEHYFIRQDGFRVSKNIELGKTDTANFSDNAFNRFEFEKENNGVVLSSPYSEEPFYISKSGIYQIASASFPANGHTLSLTINSIPVHISFQQDKDFEVNLPDVTFKFRKDIRKGISIWNSIRDLDSFINSGYYTNPSMLESLKNIYFLRDSISRTGYGEMKYFISGKLFRIASSVKYDSKSLQLRDLSFKTQLQDGSRFAWGIGFQSNNKNQYLLKYGNGNDFTILNRYPTSYPLSEEQKDNWTRHTVNKFLVSTTHDLERMPPVFSEGFWFTISGNDSTDFFSPVLLSYQKDAGNRSPQIKAARLNKLGTELAWDQNQLLLPAQSGKFQWIFSLRNTYNWEFGDHQLTSDQWQLRIFGMLVFFFLMVFLTAALKPAEQSSWVWQLLSCIAIVFLATRLFLYWRYKSFPPYEGMDLPSQQQLQSIWNFRIVIVTGIALALFFGFDLIRQIYKRASGRIRKEHLFSQQFEKMNFFKRSTQKYPKQIYFISWLFLLAACFGWAYLKNFDVNDCRHISLVLMVIYFIFLFISYRHSPLVASAEKSWWKMDTSQLFHLLVSNPVKVLLSLSLMGVFIFIDIGFAIVFLNFLLFNEAFLNINYSISGLSAGNSTNRKVFVISAIIYSVVFILNLLFAPYFLGYVLQLPQLIFTLIFSVFLWLVILSITRVLFPQMNYRRLLRLLVILLPLLSLAYFKFIPKEIILDKAERTKYRIDVLTMPPDKAIQLAYREGKTYEPVIRAAQNQWFINTFIYEENNPAAHSFYFHLLPQSPQNKGAKYNAQATDLVASRFFIAEHGKGSVLLYVLLLLLPVILLAPIYKLYPDFTNRINNNYPTVTLGFTLLNYLLISALLVILAATGKYIFFGQDLPFGSILSKQSVLFPSFLIVMVILLFKSVPAQYYSNRKKNIPGIIIFLGLLILLVFVKPVFNKNKEFNITDLSKDMNSFIDSRIQPVWTYINASGKGRKMSLARKDAWFTDSLRKMIASGAFDADNSFFKHEIIDYSRTDFTRHLDQKRFLYLDMNSGSPQMTTNSNYFRIEPPPHLEYAWNGNIFGDTTVYNISLWDHHKGTLIKKHLSNFTDQPAEELDKGLMLAFKEILSPGLYKKLFLVNTGSTDQLVKSGSREKRLAAGDSLLLSNPDRIIISEPGTGNEKTITVEPDAFMKNYFVNGSRFYIYPLGNDFLWARNFAESITADFINGNHSEKNAIVSLDFEMMDSLAAIIRSIVGRDSSYKKGAEYGICIADGSGRLLAMSDFIKNIDRPDPNDKAAFKNAINGDNGLISQSALRKMIGNINLMRLNPGPGSTLKPIVFSSVASQLNINWDQFASEGFSKPQNYFGGEKVAQYDFEEYHGLVKKVTDYFRLSDNYFHSNVILLGSYPKQVPGKLLSTNFVTQKPDTGTHWPYFFYNGKTYWLDGFQNWPGYQNGKAHFGTDSSYISIGMLSNFGIYNRNPGKSFDRFNSVYDSVLFGKAGNRSGFILPESSLFDQQGGKMNMNVPYDVFANCFRGHVIGSSQVLIPPVKMVEAFGRLVTQNRNYNLTLNPYVSPVSYNPFYTDSTIGYNTFLSLMRDGVFTGMREALFRGTAGKLGSQLKDGSPYFYYAKTGTTGDNEIKTKSKLFAIVISAKDITSPDYTFKNFNKFFTIYFTSQNGPSKQNDELQKRVIRYLENSTTFKKLMEAK